jgi:hypothetical protein
MDDSGWLASWLGTADAALLAGTVAALAVCATRPLWRAARLPVTAAHELGHALVALLLGGKVARVHLWLDTAGLTTYSMPARAGRARRAAVALAGYPAPGLAGLAAAGLVAAGLARWLLAAAAVVALILLVLWVRNPWGVFSTLLSAAALAWIAFAGPAWWVTALAAGLAALLLAGGWRAAATHASGRERDRHGASDSVMASRLLYAPARLWSGLFVLAATATLLGGCWLLLTAGQ